MARRGVDRRAASDDQEGGASSPLLHGYGTTIYAFIAVDRDWKITYMDGPAIPGSSRQRQDLIGANFWETFPAVIGTPFDHRYREAVATGKPVEIEQTTSRHEAHIPVTSVTDSMRVQDTGCLREPG